MYLTREEERMLSGELGEPAAKAIELLVRVGEALGAERLIEIAHAHVSGVSYFNVGEPGLEFIEDMLRAGARFAVFATANPYAALATYGSRSFDESLNAKQMRIVEALRSMGVSSFTCAPYYVRTPRAGEHLAWAESSAVLYANSLLGAMTNREPGLVALMAGISGRTYFGEAHRGLPKEVKYVVEVERPGDPSEAGAYGLLAGELLGGSVPLVRGLESLPEGFLKEFLAAFATSSPSHLAVLDGVTPGYRGVSAEGAERVSLGRSEISRLYSEARDCSSPIYLIGCPHLSLEELESVLREARRVERGELWLTVGEQHGRYLAEARLAEGVKILTGACAVTTRLDLLGVDCVITDSAKALAYLPKLAGVRAFLVRRRDLLRMVPGHD